MLTNNTYKPALPKTQLIADWAANNFEPKNQNLILIEEMSELTKCLLKHRRSPYNHKIEEKIVEEFSHVLISLEVFRQIHGISHASIEREAQKKLDKYGVKNGNEDDYPWDDDANDLIKNLIDGIIDEECGYDKHRITNKARSFLENDAKREIKRKLKGIVEIDDNAVITEKLLKDLFQEAIDEWEVNNGLLRVKED